MRTIDADAPVFARETPEEQQLIRRWLRNQPTARTAPGDQMTGKKIDYIFRLMVTMDETALHLLQEGEEKLACELMDLTCSAGWILRDWMRARGRST